jgi:hypothetical protein
MVMVTMTMTMIMSMPVSLGMLLCMKVAILTTLVQMASDNTRMMIMSYISRLSYIICLRKIMAEFFAL